ncbi:MAG: DCC1-like thiol-disulfide oxidoreductase family protein [Terriglobia bacterium]
MAAKHKLQLVYDAQCPVCDAYCQRVAVDSDAGQLELVDARQNGAVVHEITEAGLDVDQGMVLKAGGRLYYGAEAIHELALRSSRHGLFSRLNYYLFRWRQLANVLYPLLRTGRNLLLKALRRTKINNLQIPDNDQF